MYKIAEYLTDEAKRAAAKAEYTRLDGDYRRTDDWQCPLGVALETMGVPAPAVESRWSTPGYDEVASALDNPDIEDAAQEFIDDWDENVIDDLAAALGLADAAHEGA